MEPKKNVQNDSKGLKPTSAAIKELTFSRAKSVFLFICLFVKGFPEKLSIVTSPLKNLFSKNIYMALKLDALKEKLHTIGVTMIGPIEKGFQRASVESPPQGSYKEVDLRLLPKYISYKAALLREKLTLYYILTAVLLLFVAHYLISRSEISDLYGRLREKEYILAPGVIDFTAALPQRVPDSYIHDATMDFLSDLGNISATNIDEQYDVMKRFMSHELKVRFEADSSDWVEQVKTDNISQILKVTDVEIISNRNGAYKVVAMGRVDFFTSHEYLGHEDQVIQMTLKLVPPESGKRWFLQMTDLLWEKADKFNSKSSFNSQSNPFK